MAIPKHKIALLAMSNLTLIKVGSSARQKEAIYSSVRRQRHFGYKSLSLCQSECSVLTRWLGLGQVSVRLRAYPTFATLSFHLHWPQSYNSSWPPSPPSISFANLGAFPPHLQGQNTQVDCVFGAIASVSCLAINSKNFLGIPYSNWVLTLLVKRGTGMVESVNRTQIEKKEINPRKVHI